MIRAVRMAIVLEGVRSGWNPESTVYRQDHCRKQITVKHESGGRQQSTMGRRTRRICIYIIKIVQAYIFITKF